jgi:hypothetical protein
MMKPQLTIPALDEIARRTNHAIRDEIVEVLGEKASYPTVSPAAVKIVLDIAVEMGLIAYMPTDTPPPAQEATRDVLWPDERISKALGVVSDAQIDYPESFIVPLVMALHACQAIRDDYEAELNRRATLVQREAGQG